MKKYFVFLMLFFLPMLVVGQTAGGQIARPVKTKPATPVKKQKKTNKNSVKSSASKQEHVADTINGALKEETLRSPKTPSSPQPIAGNTSSEPVEAAGYDVSFISNVSSATLEIDGVPYGTASGTRFLKTGTHVVKLTAEGYEPLIDTILVNSATHSATFTMVAKKIISLKYKALNDFVKSICSLYDVEPSKTDMKVIAQRYGVQQKQGINYMEIELKDGTEFKYTKNDGKCFMITINPQKIKKAFPFMDGMGWESSYSEWNDWFVTKGYDNKPYDPYYGEQSMLSYSSDDYYVILMFSGKENKKGTWFSLIITYYTWKSESSLTAATNCCEWTSAR